jgi:hypothetical protein
MKGRFVMRRFRFKGTELKGFTCLHSPSMRMMRNRKIGGRVVISIAYYISLQYESEPVVFGTLC